jgi:hypothetical protein
VKRKVAWYRVYGSYGRKTISWEAIRQQPKPR